jgi:hypothetical protein
MTNSHVNGRINATKEGAVLFLFLDDVILKKQENKFVVFRIFI